MSLMTPTVTPEILTGFPSASPVTLSSRTLYSFLREKIFCSEPMKKTKIISTSRAAETRSPTRIVFSFGLVAIVSYRTVFLGCGISVSRLRGRDGGRFQKLAQHRVIGIARIFHRPHPLENPFVEKGDAVADRERRLDVVRDHDRGNVQFRLQIDDQLVDLLRRDGIESGGGLVVEDHLR